jgi:hypothetical protein
VRSLDATGDWVWGTGIQSYLVNQAAVAQCIETDCTSFLGDCFFNVTAGIDWYNLLTVNNLLAIQLAVSATILNVGGGGFVTGILNVLASTNDTTRLFSIQYSVITVYSSAPLSGLFSYSGATSG